MSDIPRKPITMSLSIDEAIYPELYARLLPLGKGSRTEMMRQLAQETLVRRIAQQFAATQALPHHGTHHASQQTAAAAPAAPQAAPMPPAKAPTPPSAPSAQPRTTEAPAPAGDSRRTSVLPMDLLRG